jgi:hypothetical protein
VTEVKRRNSPNSFVRLRPGLLSPASPAVIVPVPKANPLRVFDDILR